MELTFKKIALGALSLILLLICVEIIGLIWMASSYSRYKMFWHRKAAEQASYTYVALGDSAAQGLGATSPMNGYVGHIAKNIEQKRKQPVRIINLSKSGARIRDVLDRQLVELEQSGVSPSLITIEIGANDVSEFNEVTFAEEFKLLVQKLPSGTYISDIPDFGGGPHLNNQREASKIARKIISTRDDLHFVPLESHTRRHFIHTLHHSFDFFHPNNYGYKVWSDAFIAEMNKNSDFLGEAF